LARSVTDMSSLTHAGPGPGNRAPQRSRLVGPPLALTFMAEFTSLTSFFLMFSVMPMLAAQAGAGSAAAGLITGALLAGTVIAEAAAALAIRRFGYRVVLAAGALLLGVPTLALLPREPQSVMAAVSFARGLGFGLCGVSTGALTARLLPPERRGEGLGLLGIVTGVPAIVALPAGVWLAGHHQATVAAVVAMITGLLPLAALAWLPGGRPAPQASPGPGTGRAALRLPLVFAACTAAAGVIDSFLPLARSVPSDVCSAALLVQAVAATVTRWQAGRYGDRKGHARLLVPAIVVSALGLASMVGLPSPAALWAGMVLFGAGFGVVENATFALLIERLPEARASALWNFAYDAGYGAGPAMFGLVSGHTGYPVALGLTGVLVLAAVPVARRERKRRGLAGQPGVDLGDQPRLEGIGREGRGDAVPGQLGQHRVVVPEGAPERRVLLGEGRAGLGRDVGVDGDQQPGRAQARQRVPGQGRREAEQHVGMRADLQRQPSFPHLGYQVVVSSTRKKEAKSVTRAAGGGAAPCAAASSRSVAGLTVLSR
jgi:MFS family permease